MSRLTALKKEFKDGALLEQALTHRSWVNENRGKRETNERLEFLGDAILEFVVSEELFKRFPNNEEGFLTTLRASLVNTANLANLARRIGVGEAIFLSKGEEDGGGRDNPSLLADTTEAIIGALFLDQGLAKVEPFIQENLFVDLQEKISQPLKDAKSRLQEQVQASGFLTPKYRVVGESGPDHAKNFHVEVVVNGEALARGVGKSKNEASQKAAEAALASLVKGLK